MLKYEYLSKYSFAEMGKEIQLRAHALKVIASLIYHYYSPEKKKKSFVLSCKVSYPWNVFLFWTGTNKNYFNMFHIAGVLPE